MKRTRGDNAIFWPSLCVEPALSVRRWATAKRKIQLSAHKIESNSNDNDWQEAIKQTNNIPDWSVLMDSKSSIIGSTSPHTFSAWGGIRFPPPSRLISILHHLFFDLAFWGSVVGNHPTRHVSPRATTTATTTTTATKDSNHQRRYNFQ